MNPTQKLIEAAEAAVEALAVGRDYAEGEQFENAQRYKGHEHLAPNDAECIAQIDAAIVSLRTALQGLREAQAEPVAWQGVHDHTDLYWRKPPQADVRPLYATPPTTDAPAQWISVDERLPTPRDDGSDVPVWTWNGEFVTEDDYAEQFEQPAGPAVGGWISTGWDFYQNASVGRAAVTHWMPRETPKPPTAAPTQEGAPK